MSRQDSILTANPISWKCKKTLAIWSTPIISSILLRWALFLLDSRSLRAILWNKNPKCKKPLERFVLTDTTCGMACLHHQGFWIETSSSRSMPISSLSRNHPAFTHWKSCFQLKFSQCCCNWTPPKMPALSFHEMWKRAMESSTSHASDAKDSHWNDSANVFMHIESVRLEMLRSQVSYLHFELHSCCGFLSSGAF